MTPGELIATRKALRYSQSDMATELGVNRVTYNRYERGRAARGIPQAIADHVATLDAKPLYVAPSSTPHLYAVDRPIIKRGRVVGYPLAPQHPRNLYSAPIGGRCAVHAGAYWHVSDAGHWTHLGSIPAADLSPK